jgi:hypothetical protein
MQAVVSRACATTTTGGKTTTVHERPVRQRRRTCAAPSPEQPGSVAHRDKLAASVQSEPADLFVVVVIVKVIALIVKHCLRYCCRVVVDAGSGRVDNSWYSACRGSCLSCTLQLIGCGGSTGSRVLQNSPAATRVIFKSQLYGLQSL